MIKASLFAKGATAVAAVVLLTPAPAVAATAARGGENTPVDLTGASDTGAAHVGGGGSIVRTIVGLAIVIGVIYGVAWVLRQVKASRAPQATGSGLASLASVPLGANRSVHLVRAGTDLVLLGVADNGVVPIRTYSEDEARLAGLVDDEGMLILPEEETSPRRERPRLPRLALPAATKAAASDRAAAHPRQRLALPAPKDALDTLRSWTVRS